MCATSTVKFASLDGITLQSQEADFWARGTDLEQLGRRRDGSQSPPQPKSPQRNRQHPGQRHCRWDGPFSPALIAARAYFGGEEVQNRTSPRCRVDEGFD